MSSILLVVANAGTPTTGDALLKTTLEGMGHTVTYVSDETAENVTGFNGVVISESVAGATLGSKYATVAIPIVCHEQGYLDDMGFCLTANIQQLGTQTQVIWVETEPIADGPFGAFSGTDTIFSSSVTIGAFDNTGGTASGVVEIATSAAGTSSACAIAERGATLHIGAAAERRVFIWPQDAASANLNADGLNAVKNAYAWAFNAPTVVVEIVIPAGESYPWAEDLPLEAGETLQGYFSTSAIYSAEVLADSPSGYFRLDEASGVPQDSSGNGRHFDAVEGSTPDYQVDGAIVSEPNGGDAMRLNLTESLARTSGPWQTVTDNWTLELWAKLGGASTSNGRNLFKNGNAVGYGVVVDIDGTFAWENLGTGLGSNAVAKISASEWKLIHVVRRSGTVEYYVNGQLDTANAGGGAPSTPSGTSRLGASTGLDVYIDEVAIYPTALSAATILERYQASLVPVLIIDGVEEAV